MKQYIVDAFTDKIFSGNPAAVCVVKNFPAADLMQKIAMENNLSETAFIDENYNLRWFTPAAEIDFCGHATLASGFVILTQIAPNLDFVEFETMRGKLKVTKAGEFFEMDFPAYEYKKIPVTAEMQAAINAEISAAYLSRDLLMIVKDAETVEKLQPNFSQLEKLEGTTQAVTAADKNFDCVSRVFAPKVQVNEDPVTGSTHCLIAPYWAEILGKKKILARQASKRGGILHCEICGERVKISGQAALFATSEINI